MGYTSQAKKALDVAKRYSKKMNHNYIGTEHLLMGLVKSYDSLASRILENHGIIADNLDKLIEELISTVSEADSTAVLEREGNTPKMEAVLSQARAEADKCKSQDVGTEHLLISIIKNSDCAAARLLTTMDVNISKLFSDIVVAMGLDGTVYKEEMASRMRSRKSDGILKQFSRDLTELAKNGDLDPIVGRELEIKRVVQILSRRNKNNPCLIGEPGVGKTAIVEGLAERIISGDVPDSVKGKKVVSLDLSSMVAGTKYRGEFEERIKKVIAEVAARGDIILFIDEMHTLIGAGGSEGSLDASNILKPAMARGEIQVIGATTITEFRKYVEKDAALERRFQSVMVEEPSEEDTIEILKGIRHLYEEHHYVEITDQAVEACVSLSQRYVSDRFLPDKAIDLMDEASAKIRLNDVKAPKHLKDLQEAINDSQAQLENALSAGDLEAASLAKKNLASNKDKLARVEKRYSKGKNNKLVLTFEDVAGVVSDWTKIPVSRLNESEAVTLRNLEKTLSKRVIGQEDALSAVSRAVRRGRVGLKEEGRPIGSFLFLGPTGVGKTEISKALAQAVFGNEDAMIRIDMTEYMEKHSVSKLIGSPPGYVGFEDGGQLSEKVRRNPYSLILFDEIEKAHPDVFNILLQVLDDGHITDSQGRKVNFKNTIIIMTSNAGASSIIEPKKLGFASVDDEKADYETMKSSVMEEVKRIFKPEFLNRIDETIVFRALNKDDMTSIVTIMTSALVTRCKDQMDIELKIKPSAKKWIVDKAYDPKYGARPLRRKIQTDLEDALCEEFLQGKIKSKSTVEVTVKKDSLFFNVV